MDAGGKTFPALLIFVVVMMLRVFDVSVKRRDIKMKLDLGIKMNQIKTVGLENS
jgi:hypothetical protein